MRPTRALLVASSLALALPALADDGELRLMREPFSYTDVVDALDGPDPFDLNVSVGFVRSRVAGTLQRETNVASSTVPTPGDGRSSANFLDIASHEHLINTLELGVDVGLFHDLAVYGRLPLVLSDTRTLTAPSGRSSAQVNADLATVEPDGAAGRLFDVPFTSPARSGVDALHAGVAWAIFNQARERSWPTLLFMAEGRFSLGEPLHPCFDTAPAGVSERCRGGSEPGISQGTNGLRLETRASWRYRYLEPYGGLAFQMAWPGTAADFFSPSGDLDGFMNTLPPRLGEMTVGVAVIPWEHPGRWQRFAIDVRLGGTYVSEGHGYSPLFDALGTSQSDYLRTPTAEGTGAGARQVDFYGLTDMQAHGRVRARLAVEMQAARYVRFSFGAEAAFATAYLLTFADACNPNITPSAGDTRVGSCRSGIVNPHHRPVIDLIGQRFRVANELSLDIFANAIAQF